MASFLRTLLSSSLAAAGLTGGATWSLNPDGPFPYRFEAKVESTVRGEAKVYYDRGAGLSEGDSVGRPVQIGVNHLSLPLPAGEYRLIRFDPINGPGRVIVSDVRIATRQGWKVRTIELSEFKPNEQIAAAGAERAGAAFVAPVRVNDPQLALALSPPLHLRTLVWQRLIGSPAQFAIWFAAILALLLAIRKGWRSCERWLPPLLAAAAQRPRTAVTLASVAAAVASSYPVVFFGQSFVSPNNGALLLYDGRPTVPGYTDLRPENIYGTDVGAMMWQHLPYTVVQQRALADADLPLWNRYSSCGATLFGQGQSMFGDPLHFLAIAAGGAAWAFDLKFVLMKAVFCCGVGWAVWLLTRSSGVSLLLTVSAAFISFFNSRLNHPAIFSLGYSPWVLVGWFAMMRARNLRELRVPLVLWFVGNWALLTSGTVKEAYLLSIALNLTGGVSFLLATGPLHRGARMAVAGMAAAAFALASAPWWWVFLDSLATSITTYDIPRVYQIPRGLVLGLFDDLFYREFFSGYNSNMPGTNLLVLIGCLCGFVALRRLATERVPLLILLGGLLAVAVAFGWIPAAWILRVPLVRNVYHVNDVFSNIAIVHACVFAGWGLAAARAPLREGRTLRIGLVAAVVLAAILVPFLSYPGQRIWSAALGRTGWWPVAPRFAVLAAYLALIPIATSVFLYAARRYLRCQVVPGGVALAVGVILFLLLVRHGQHVPLFRTDRYFSVPGERANLFVTSPSVDWVREQIRSTPQRVLGLGNNVYPGFASVYGFEGINGPDALDNRHYREFVEAAGLAVQGNWRFNLITPDNLQASHPVLDFLNVRYLLAPPGHLHEPPGFRRVAALDFDIYASETAWPRAFFTDRIRCYETTDELVGWVRDAHGQPFAAVQAADWPQVSTVAQAAARAQAVPQAPFGAARDYKLRANTTRFSVHAPGPGVVVLHENWLPQDFSATLNGRPVPCVRINHTFKGVVIPAAGDYRVDFTYRPHHLTAALVASAAGFVLFVLLLWVASRRDLLRGASLASAQVDEQVALPESHR